MQNTRFDTGMAQLKRIDGAQGESVMEALAGIAPDVGKYIVEFAFGDIYTRNNGLNLRDREMITLASLLTSGGCEAQLHVHIHGALNVVIPPKTIIEIFIQCIPYTGFPKALNAIFVAKEIFEAEKISLDD